jgi:hypothetical protein
MEYALQKLPALVNDLSLSIRNPILVYSFFALYGLMMLVLVTYVHIKFRTAAKTLKLLQTEWKSAESQHSTFVGAAQERLSKLTLQAPAVATGIGRAAAIGSDIRNQIVAMAKRGIAIHEIARNCGLQEGEVDVILGMARLRR